MKNEKARASVVHTKQELSSKTMPKARVAFETMSSLLFSLQNKKHRMSVPMSLPDEYERIFDGLSRDDRLFTDCMEI